MRSFVSPQRSAPAISVSSRLPRGSAAPIRSKAHGANVTDESPRISPSAAEIAAPPGVAAAAMSSVWVNADTTESGPRAPA